MLNKIQSSPVPQHGLERCHGYSGIKAARLCWQTVINELFFSFLRLLSRWEWKHDKINKLSKTKTLKTLFHVCFDHMRRGKMAQAEANSEWQAFATEKRQHLYVHCNLPARGRSERSVCLATPLLAGLALL